MSFPFGSGMPQPGHHQQQSPYPSNQQQQHYPQPPFGAGYPMHAPQHAAGASASGTGAPFGAGFAPYPPGPAANHHQQSQNYSQYPTNQAPYAQQPYPQQQQQPYPAGPPLGGVPVFPPQPHHGGGYPSAAGAAYPSYGQPTAYGQQPPQHYQQQQYQQQHYQQQHYQQQQQQHAPTAAMSRLPKGTPIIRPAEPFDPVEDAKLLRKAMKGFGTDEAGLIAVLCHRSNDQIQRIKLDYKTHFGRDLLEDVRSETSGKFETVLCALLLPRLDYYVKELNDAMAGLGTDEDALVEILCSLSNYEIQAIKHHYKQVYYKDLEAELMSETSGHFKRLLVSLCTGGRDESGHVDVAAAQADATALLRAGELRAGTDESTFNSVLCQRSYAQIRAVCDEYQRLTGHSLVKAIEKEFSGDIRDGLVAVVQCMSNKASFFAHRLHKSMAGLGTTDSQLIRVLVMRAEVDLADVKAEFEQLYGKPLRSWIKGDTSGHYKHALYHLIGETPSS